MANNIIVRPIGPITSALSNLREALYKPPQEVIRGVDETLWPNPLQPVRPMGPPKAEPLGWPFQWGRNLIFTPREDAEYSAEDLRRLAKYPLARICIENNKDILTRISHRIQLKRLPGETSKEHAQRSKNDTNLKKLNAFFENPNPNQNWEDFLRPVLEDMLVIDAASIFVGRTNNGEVTELRWVDGSSITCLVEEHGWTPKPPNPAYQQLWQGYPRVDLTTEQLIYRPRNIVPRNTQASYLYGFSPTEQIADEIKIGLARLEYIYTFYSDGTIPGGILFAPLGTPVDKISEAQQWMDSDLAGQLAKRRRLQILQGFQKDGQSEQVVFPKEPQLTDLFDDIHIRKIAFAYGVSPSRLMKMMNRSASETMQTSAEEEGTLPWLTWMKGVMDHIIQVQMKQPDYEFMFDPFQELDALKRAMADAKDVEIGMYTINEKRVARGDDPRPEPDADKLLTRTASGFVPLGETTQKEMPGGKQPGVPGNESPKTSQVRSPKGPNTSPEGAGGHAANAAAKASKSNGHTTWEENQVQD